MIGAALAHIRQTSPRDLAITLTLLVTLLHNPGPAAPFVTVIAVGALIHRPLALRGEMWLAVAAIRVVSIGPVAWFSIDNHHYLLTYWYLGLGVALLGHRTDNVVAFTSRWLLGLAFAFAVFWKVVSPDFPSGAYFEFMLVSDLRLRALGEAIGGIGESEILANQAAVSAMLVSGEAGPVTLVTHRFIAPAAQVLAIGTILLEALVALFVLLPRRWVPSALRHGAILAFVWTTYVLAPIVGFAWVVLVLAVAQTRQEEGTARIAHVLTFIVVPAVAYAATLGSLAGPVLGALAAVGLFLGYLHTDRALLRDGAILVTCLSGGLLLQTSEGVANATAWAAVVAVTVVMALRWAGRGHMAD